VTWRTVHCSDPDEQRDSDDGTRWQDEAPVREVITSRGVRRLVLDDGPQR
jgi:hypothetical protein